MRYVIFSVFFVLFFTQTNAQNKPYKGAELFTPGAVTYGKFEFRMRVAKGSGVLSTFFLYKDGSEQSQNFWEEIDVEVFGKDNAETWQSNILTGFGGPTGIEAEHDTNLDLSEGYYTYTVEWRPDSVVWKFEDQVIRTVTGTPANDLTNPQSVRFNIWSAFAEAWVGPFDDSILPVHQYVNWIQYYQWNGTDFDTTPTWEDDFSGTTIDSNRWSKATWTFDANRTDFAPANLKVQNGYLILSLTKAGEEGYTGTPPEDAAGSSLSVPDFSEAPVKLVAFPSPVLDQITIEGPVETTLRILDLNGRIVQDDFKLQKGKEQFDFSHLTTGIYVLEASLNNLKFQQKLVKQ